MLQTTSMYELAVALANATEGAARATVLKVTQTEPSPRVRGMASIGRRQRAQVVQRPGDSAAGHTRDAQEVQVCEGVEGKAHSVVVEGG